MNDDDQKQKDPQARPLDPARSGEDVLGDTTGLTGVTTGKSAQTSSTPDDAPKDENKDHLSGGLVNTEEKVEEESSGTRVSTAMGRIQDITSHPADKETDERSPDNVSLSNQVDDTSLSQPYNQGEQSISGSAPDPEADDDTLANAQEVGSQLGEDEEHPKELDIASDIDKAELHHRSH